MQFCRQWTYDEQTGTNPQVLVNAIIGKVRTRLASFGPSSEVKFETN